VTVAHPLSYYRKKAKQIQDQMDDEVKDESSNSANNE
jgi:hypothetical protein